MKRFELEYGIAVEVYEEGDGKYAPRQVVLTAPDTEPFGIPGPVAAALCAALTECGFGPEEPTCRWSQDPARRQWGGSCHDAELYDENYTDTREWAFCPHCGKRIEVVR